MQETSLTQLIKDSDIRGLRAVLDELPISEIVDRLERMDTVDRAVAFRALHKDQAISVFESFDPAVQSELLDGLREETTIHLFSELDPDDRASLLDELPAKVASRLLHALEPEERVKTTELLGYPSNSVGRRMTPEVVAIPQKFTVGQALSRIRKRGQGAETIYLLPIIDSGRRLVGVISLRRLLLTDDSVPVTKVMNDPVMIHASADIEQAARLVRDEGLLVLPVVDGEERLLGFFTVDDAMDTLERAESEDIAKSAAAEPLRQPYLTSRIRTLVRTRIVWLLVLVIAATLTVNVLDYFEATIAQVITLTLFIPLLIGTGGNVGAQSATTVVRALATGDVEFQDLPRVVAREVSTGLSIGLILASIAVIPAALLASGDLAIVLGVSLILVCALATLIGSTIPILAQKIGVDPAVVSAPFITTIVDTTGLIVYFLVAQRILGL